MILLDRITKTYPGDEEPALDNISLHIEPHEFVFWWENPALANLLLLK